MLYILYISILFSAILLYFRVASYYKIIDRPNQRSSHSVETIRGGGIIFPIAGLIVLIQYPSFWMFILGMLTIGTISFIDDRIMLSNKVRLFFHLAAVTLLFTVLGMFQIFPIYITLSLYIFVIGTINAYNFMDGINGITGVYSLVVLGGFQYINCYEVNFIEPDLIWLPMLASLVFLFFNFRKRARCFAGDVGSITIAFWILFLLLKLVIDTGNYSYILFLAVYGVDTVLTILHRLMLKENIFQAHRLHFYQILANEQKVSHLLVSSVYGFVQLIIIALVILSQFNLISLLFITILPLTMIYIFFKSKLMKVKV